MKYLFFIIPFLFIFLSCNTTINNDVNNNYVSSNNDECFELSLFLEDIEDSNNITIPLYKLEYDTKKSIKILDSLINEDILFLINNKECYELYKNDILKLEEILIKLEKINKNNFIKNKLDFIRKDIELLIYEILYIREYIG